MTERWVRLPHQMLGPVSNRVVHEVRGIDRVRPESSEPSGKLCDTTKRTQTSSSLIRYAAASAQSATTAKQNEEVGCDAITPGAAGCLWR